jgi:hypothetical protein
VYSSCLVTRLQSACNCLLLTCSSLLDSLISLMLLRSACAASVTMLAMLSAYEAAAPKGLDPALPFPLATIVPTRPEVQKDRRIRL